MVAWEGLKMGSNVWISEWTGHSGENSNTMFLLVYAALAVSFGVMALVRMGVLVFGSLKCSKLLHKRMSSSVLFASLNDFFERVPLGRILNRFSKDIQVVDMDLSYSIGVLFASFSTIVGDTILCIYASSIWVAIPLLLFAYSCSRL